MLQLGIQALDQADFVRALDLCNDGLKLNTADNKLTARLHHNKGCALVELRQYALAIVECCKAIDLDRDMWRPYIVRHLAWRHVGLYTRAAEVTSCTWLALSTCTWLMKALSVNALLPDLSMPNANMSACLQCHAQQS